MVCEPSTDHPLFAFVLHFSGNITARWHQSERLSTAISVIIRTGSDHFNPVLDHPQSNWWPEESAMLKELFRLRRILFVSKINVYECFVRHWSRNNMQRYCPSQSPRPGASKHANRPLPPLYVEYNIAVFFIYWLRTLDKSWPIHSRHHSHPLHSQRTLVASSMKRHFCAECCSGTQIRKWPKSKFYC